MSMLFLLQPPIPDFVWFQNVVIPILGMGLGAFVFFGFYRTVNRQLDRRHEKEMAATRGHASPELEELRGRVELLEEVAMRLHELEERVDFAERMLAQQQHPKLDSGRGS